VKQISSRANPLVRTFRALASGRTVEDRRLLLDGAHLVQEARAAGVPITTLAVSAHALDDPEVAALVRAIAGDGAEVLVVPDALFPALSPVRSPSGVVAIAEHDVVPIDAVFASSPPLVVVAIDVQDPGNVGALVRAAEAGGATGAVWCGASADPFGWKALRGSMGSAFRLRITRAGDLQIAIDGARAAGARLVATTPRQGTNLYEANLEGPVAILIGGEGPGLPDAVVAAADLCVSIPMKPPVESLNVAVATALIVYEAARQRGARGPAGDPRRRAGARTGASR
jgi:TrmH family RNA methyltransferase